MVGKLSSCSYLGKYKNNSINVQGSQIDLKKKREENSLIQCIHPSFVIWGKSLNLASGDKGNWPTCYRGLHRRSQVGYCMCQCFGNCKVLLKLLGWTGTGQVHSVENGIAFKVVFEKQWVAGWKKGMIG